MSARTIEPRAVPLGAAARAPWRVTAVGWVAGAYLVVLGMARLILTLNSAEPGTGPSWLRGAISAAGGLALLLVAAGVFSGRLRRIVCLLVVLPQVVFGAIFLAAGLYSAGLTLLILALGVLAACLLPSSADAENRRPDVAAVMLAAMVVVQGADLLVRGAATGATPPGFPIAPQVVGGLFVLAGLAVIVVQALEGSAGQASSGLLWAVHLFAGGLLLALWAGQSIVLGGSAWIYGAAAVLRGLALALMPLLSARLAALDTRSLRPRLMVTLVLIGAVPVMVALTLVVDVPLIANADAARQMAFTIMLGAMIFAALVGAWISARLTRPLEALVRDVRQVVDGSRTEPLEQSGPTEVRRLAESVTQMAQALDGRAAARERLAHEAAIEEERQRLARDLHDSVSQTITAMGMSAYSALHNWDIRPEAARDRIELVQTLGRRAQAEMRALIFELRPDKLESDGLVKALELQAAALAERAEFAVDVHLCPEPAVPLPVKEAFYRIALEAMHNAAKHAGPQRISLTLTHTAGRLALTVTDDGKGFDTGGSFPGHLGLRSMRERAARAGATLTLQSGPTGTRIRVVA